MKLNARGTIFCLGALLLWLVITALFLGFRPEHIGLAILIAALFFISVSTRKFLVAIIPFILFGISYDWMNLLPNYEVNPIDTEGIYNFEKSIFGIVTDDGVALTPNEFFSLYTNPILDFLSGIFYLCWVPVPILFGFYLYFGRKTRTYVHFALVFLLVNLIGFSIYYLHPAAPPWYIAQYGFEPIVGTPGNVAGLGAFDTMTGTKIFETLYGRNSNVFAALPSLHSAYPLIAFYYSLGKNVSGFWKIFLAVISLGIWFTAVYSSHHYVVDALAGIGVTVIGILLFEVGLMHIGCFRNFLNRYVNYISISKI